VEDQAVAMERTDLMLINASARLTGLTKDHDDLQAAYEAQSAFLLQYAGAIDALKVRDL
jgi:hypothetical protein